LGLARIQRVTPRLVIRDALPQEYGPLADVVMSAYGDYDAFVDDEFKAGFAAEVPQLMNDEHTEVIVAERDGEPVGSITFYPDGRFYEDGVPADWACLRTLAVLPSARGQGVGRALMTECLERARRLGRTRMLLHTISFMSAAIGLHESLGFQRAPELDVEYAGVTVIAYLMEL
jgi:GNAT superfamily N-acetyltransferase